MKGKNRKPLHVACYYRLAIEEKAPKRAWLYSHTNKVHDHYSELSGQIFRLSELAREMNYEIVGTSSDIPFLGTDHPELRVVMDNAKRHSFDVLLINDITALGQQALQIFDIIRELENLGIITHTVKHGVVQSRSPLNITITTYRQKDRDLTVVYLQPAAGDADRGCSLLLPASLADLNRVEEQLGPYAQEGGVYFTNPTGVLADIVEKLEYDNLAELNLLAHVVDRMEPKTRDAFLALTADMECLRLPWLISTAAAMEQGLRHYYTDIHSVYDLGRRHALENLLPGQMHLMASLPFQTMGEQLLQSNAGILAGSFFVFNQPGPDFQGDVEELQREYMDEPMPAGMGLH